jgi:hypothetical protein
LVLRAMTCKMDKVGVLDAVSDAFDRGVICDGVDTALVPARLHRFRNDRNLPLHGPQGLHCTPCSDAVFSHSEHVEAIRSGLRFPFLCVE